MLAADLYRNLILILSLATSLLPSCSREPLAIICPEVESGDLVITEIRGNQSSTADILGQWIEIMNTSNQEISPRGLSIVLQKLDGSSWRDITIRNPALAVSSNDYLVVGNFDNSNLPSHVDAGYLDDFSSNLYSDGVLEIYSCNRLIDRVVYYNLPSTGTLSFDGATIPDSAANDEASNWCIDNVGASAPGTPGQANNPC